LGFDLGVLLLALPPLKIYKCKKGNDIKNKGVEKPSKRN